MKTFLLVSLTVFSLAFTSSDPLASLQKLELKEYMKTLEGNQVTFCSVDTLVLYCCALNPLYAPEPADSFPYCITIRYEETMPQTEIIKRRHVQDSLLTAYRALENQRNTHHLYHNFIISKNAMDSLSIPYKEKNGYSIFVTDNLETYGYQNFTINRRESILSILAARKEIFRALNIPYSQPSWLNEYAPGLSEHFIKGRNTDF